MIDKKYLPRHAFQAILSPISHYIKVMPSQGKTCGGLDETPALFLVRVSLVGIDVS